MKIEELKKRIDSGTENIAKLEKKINKLKGKLSLQTILTAENHYKLGLYDWHEECKKNVPYQEMWEADELRSAMRDLDDKSIKLNKNINLLKMEEEKADLSKMMLDSPITEIWNFLLEYKEKCKEYIRKNTEMVDLYYEADRKHCDMWNNLGRFKREHTEEEIEEYKLEMNEWDKKSVAYKNRIDPITFRVYNYHKKTVNEAELEKIFQEDIEARYIELVEKVTKIVGEITDSSNLHTTAGELNGTITGTLGKVKVQTVGAGGYNNDIILDSGRHGQRFHFRTLVHKI